jgi:hypothetical protein
MTSAVVPGFLNKKEIETNYGRSYRSLTRDITRAVKSRDANILQHLKLVTEDEQIREGSEVTLDLIQELSNRGLRPMWVAEETWVADWVLKKTREGDPTAQPAPEPKPSPSIIKSETSAPLHFYQQRIHDLEKQNELLTDQLKIKDDQIRAGNQLAEQSQQLMRDLHVLLKNVQDGLLGEGRPLVVLPKPGRDARTKNTAGQQIEKPDHERSEVESRTVTESRPIGSGRNQRGPRKKWQSPKP